jgi:Xaa-Pro aminopeptidase
MCLALGVVLLVEMPDATAQKPRVRLELDAAQGLIAVQDVDGWLLADQGGKNPVATYLVHPTGHPGGAWFYYVPAQGRASLLYRDEDGPAFAHVDAEKRSYTNASQIERALIGMLGAAKRVAMEYAPASPVASLTRVDPEVPALLHRHRIDVRSSAEMVQFTKARWGDEGRVAHYVAAHHLEKLRQQALEFIAKRFAAKVSVSERDVQEFLQNGFKVRGLEGPLPVVAAGASTALPEYAPTKSRSSPIHNGSLVVIAMAARVVDSAAPIYAELAWVAYAGSEVPETYRRAFAAVAAGRDAVIALLEQRRATGKPVRGFEADREGRRVLAASRLQNRIPQPTGHSLDADRFGDGANLEDLPARDTRNLVEGTGFTIGASLYQTAFGLRTIVSAFEGRRGVEITTPRQTAISLIH